MIFLLSLWHLWGLGRPEGPEGPEGSGWVLLNPSITCPKMMEGMEKFALCSGTRSALVSVHHYRFPKSTLSME